jgi:peroxiredoxin
LNQLGQLETDLAQFRRQNVEVLAIAVQDQAGAQATANSAGATFPILSDADHRVAEAYQVYNLLGDGLAAPSIFIIDKSGQIVWSHIGQNVADRPDNQTILANLP